MGMEHSANGATHGNGDAVSSTNGALNYALELPPRTTDDQVPLSVVIERVVGLAHAELANLAETLVSHLAQNTAGGLSLALADSPRVRMPTGSGLSSNTSSRLAVRFSNCSCSYAGARKPTISPAATSVESYGGYLRDC